MNIVNGKEREITELLHGYGLNGYEAKVYFTLLVAGESKANDIARKAGVPQSRYMMCSTGLLRMASLNRQRT